jgi:hypothetical protein
MRVLILTQLLKDRNRRTMEGNGTCQKLSLHRIELSRLLLHAVHLRHGRIRTRDIVPAANPDGQLLVVGKAGPFAPADVGVNTIDGRFNRNGVDLNRNWDCDWAPAAYWRSRHVSGGAAPFSEAETTALRAFLSAPAPAGVVFWHSAGRRAAHRPLAHVLAAARSRRSAG